jgi:extradiol dioxygenase family protein
MLLVLLLCAQIVAHKVDGYNAAASANAVDGDPVPVPHFGAALTVDHFQDLAGRLTAAGVKFVIEPHLRFQGQPGEQVGMVLVVFCVCGCV